ncbi:molybdopterin-guanine dinucleotide biosynthesis protein B [Candidatus Acetothermia bacterium]|nr:MAG: molybdopterin-guanine dinucleotide biosynthesis protein B [Candidatus Acetothermia bacterium]
MRAVSIIGHKNTGKTRLIEELIPIFQARGYRVGTVKHAPHTLIQEDPNADSARHREAGAERTLLIGEDGAALFFDPAGDIAETIERAFAGVDLVLIEGMKHGPFPKLEVFRPSRALRTEPLAGEIEVIGVITAAHVALPDGVEVLSPRDPEGIADFIEERIL